MTGGSDAPWGATAQAQKRTTKVVRPKSHRPNNANSTIIQNGSESGYGKRALPVVFFSSFRLRSRRANYRENEKVTSMNPLIQLKTTPPLLITLALLCFGLLPKAQAVNPPPPGGYPNFTTAAGDNALQASHLGRCEHRQLVHYSLFSVTTGNFNTAVGAGSLDLNTADNNTAIGAAALLFNTTGTNNTATGTAALELNIYRQRQYGQRMRSLYTTSPATATSRWAQTPESILPLATITSISAILVLLVNQA